MTQDNEKFKEVIAASDRTTHAVRAFVRFLFIQLSAITIAVLVFQIGIFTQDPSECTLGICAPSPGWTLFAGLIWVVGVVWSSVVGWGELALSDPFNTRASGSTSGPGPRTPSILNTSVKCATCSEPMNPTERFCGSCGQARWA